MEYSFLLFNYVFNALNYHRYSRIEIERILSQPFAALSRQEMSVRKLLSKYHDNPEAVKRNMSVEAQGFDPHRAERTRIKMSKGMSQEELQWMSIDKILHPEVGSHIEFVSNWGDDHLV